MIAINTNSITRTFKCLDFNSKAALFNTKCCSLYGIELIDVLSPQFTKLQTQWRKSVRYALNIHPRTHNDLLPLLIGSPTLELQAYSRILCFFRKGYLHKSKFISFFFKSAMYEDYSYMGRNVNIITRRMNIQLEDVLGRSIGWLKRNCKKQREPGWRDALLRELMMCRDGLLQCPLTEEELRNLVDWICIE